MNEDNFIEPFISSFVAPKVCIRNKDGSLRSQLNFKIINKNIINMPILYIG